MKSWYQIKAQEDGKAEILIYDDIGFFGITAKDFIQDLRALKDIKDLTVRINSYGGEVFDGLAIYNVLARHPADVTVIVDGIAASIASVIAMAGDKIIMPDNAFMMIHRSWGIVIGNCEDMLDWAETMKKFDQAIVLAYQKKSSEDPADIEKLMSDESWLTARDAYDLGLCDEISEPVKLAARAAVLRFKNVPKALTETVNPAPAPAPAPKPENKKSEEEIFAAAAEESKRTAADIVALCAKAKLSDLAGEFIAKGMSFDQVKARIADADAIRNFCAAAKLDNRALNYIRAGMTKDEVQKELADLVAKRDSTEIDTHIDPQKRRAAIKPPSSH